jgi:methionine-rich copper-binding protein CopC
VRLRGGALLVLVGAVLTLVVGAVPASAHDALVSTDPADGSRVGPTPSAVVLTFDQPAVAMGTQILVTGPTGQVQTGPARLVDSTVTQAVAGGAPAGAYTVAWRVTSADGHPVSGTFSFTSTRAGTGTAPTVDASPSAAPATDRPGLPGAATAALVVLALVVIGVVVVLVRRRAPAGSHRQDGPTGTDR